MSSNKLRFKTGRMSFRIMLSLALLAGVFNIIPWERLTNVGDDFGQAYARNLGNLELKGDIDDDFDVDMTDLAKLVSRWLDTDCIDPNWCDEADIDKSQTIDGTDYGILAKNWQKVAKGCVDCHGDQDHHHDPYPEDQCMTCHDLFDPVFPYHPEACTECHPRPGKYGRRQIVGIGGDFDLASSHISGTIENKHCLNCHDVSQHQQGQVMLINPDSNGDLPWTGTGIQFCLTCHDGYPPADVNFPASHSGSGYDKSLFVGSTHANMLGGQSCIQCHNAHGSTLSSLLKNEYVTTDYNAWTQGGGDYAACWVCHDQNSVLTQDNAFNNYHNEHVINQDSPCFACHDVHSPYDSNELGLINFDPAIQKPDPPEPNAYDISYIDDHNASTSFWFDTDQDKGYCYVLCHGRIHAPEDYNRIDTPTVNCVNCHSSAQDNGDGIPVGGRRAVVDDFGRTSHHVNGAVQNSDCLVCHEQSKHQQGQVRLLDADNGQVIELTNSPVNDINEALLLVPFCLNCHDNDGEKPFSDGQTVPFVDPDLWDVAVHNLGGDVNQPLTCMGDGVFGCHANGHGSDDVKLLNSGAGAAIDQFCYSCHTEGMVQNDALSNNRPGGYVSADDIEEAFAKSRHHNLGITFTKGSGTFNLQCTTCHNPHVVTGKYWDAEIGVSPVSRPDFSDPVNNPRAMGKKLWGAAAGEKMDDFAALGTGTGGWYYSTARGGSIAWDQPAVYQPPKAGSDYAFEFGGDVLPDYTTLCLDCHSSRMSDANPPVNWGQGIGCTDNSVDPPDQRIECGAQHGLAPAGKPYYVSDEGTAGFWGSSGNPDVIFHMNYVTRGRGVGHFMRWPYDSAERSAGINFVMSCTDCHETHGSKRGGMIRERFNVNGNGDCGTGGDTSPNGENCSDGGNWNSFCNSCHYYYGGQHAGMSCGNASCHEVNSLHRIIHSTDSGAGTQLQITASGYQDSYQRPDFTPEIDTVEGIVGSNELAVTFTDGIWTNMDLTGALVPEDFWLFDKNNDNPRTITGVTHTAGEATAIITMSAPLTAADADIDTIATRGKSVWNWYEGGYENWATGIIEAQSVSAGPWPVTIIACPAATSFELNESAGSNTVTDISGLLVGTVGNAAVALPGDGYFHGDENQDTYIDFLDDTTCLLSTNEITIEARIKPTAVDLDWEDADGDGIDDINDRNATFNRVFERKRSIKITIMHTWYSGDEIPERNDRARIQVKYFVDAACRHTCPHPQWPDDDYEGNDAKWHQINTDIDQWPILNNHWYQIKVVFNSDKSDIPGSNGTPVDIFIDDQGTDGLNNPNPTPGDPNQNPDYEQWPGYVNASSTINDSSSCKWGALPGDFIAAEDQPIYIGAPPNHDSVYLFKGLIDWVSWLPAADYSGVDDTPH